MGIGAAMTDAAEYGPCLHRPPSPGQSLCQCGHQRIEMEYAARITEAPRTRVKAPRSDEQTEVDHGEGKR